MRKRQKFVITSFLLSLGFVLIQFFDVSWRYQAISVLSLICIFLVVWCLREGLVGIEWPMSLVLPPLFTAGVGVFYFLLPSMWYARVPVAVSYGVGMYALLLTENIFTVASMRTIQLFRSAQAVGFLMTLVTAFFVYDAIFSSRLPFWANGLLIGVFTFPMMLQGLWSVKLSDKLTHGLVVFSLITSLLLGEAAVALSFWPVNVTSGSLFLTATLYVLLGIFQHYLDDRLFGRVIREYLGVGLVVLLTMFFTTTWG